MSALEIPDNQRQLVTFVNDLVEKCRTSAGIRAAYCRQINMLTETGKMDGTKSIINLLGNHTDRMAAHLFSPTDLRFSVDFDNEYPENVLKQGAVAAKHLTRAWEKSNTDTTFGRGVYEGVKYGASIMKQWAQAEGEEQKPIYHKKIIMPWNFGVYREDENEISKQSVLCETVMMSMPEVWRRIWHLPDANKLFERIRANSTRGQSADQVTSFLHQVLSTSQLNTGVQQASAPPPGGIVQLNNDPNYAVMSAEVGIEMVRMHELWVQGEKSYITIQMVEPDIIIAPRFKRENILVPNSNLHPYTLIQPNEVSNYFWGRPEIVDLVEPQGLLSQWMEDAKRLFGLQVDKILGFSGYSGVTDETYDQMRGAGFFSGDPGAQIQDLTPKFPPETIPMIKLIMEIMNLIAGFPPVMQGQGEAGVRAGVHANTLMKTGSPRLRDRSLLVERQCAAAADLTLAIMEEKEGRNFWTDGTNLETIDKTTFLLSDLPEDWHVEVDSHSSSPIFADDHAQLTMVGLKMGVIGPEDAIEDLPFPNKDRKKQALKKREAAKAKFLEQHPEAVSKMGKHK